MPNSTGGRRRPPRARLDVTLTSIGLLTVGACADSPLASPAVEPPTLSSTFSRVSDGAPAAIPDQHIVLFAKGTADAPGLARRLVGEHGGELKFAYSSAVQGFAAKLSARAVEALRRNPQVASIEPDMVVRTSGVQTSPTWGLDRIDQRSLPLDQAYSYAYTGAGVTAYILDTGIRFDHLEFEGRAFAGTDVISDGRSGGDCHGHGTHVAGTVGGRQWGVAKKVSLVSVRVSDCNGAGTVSGAMAGIDWVVKNRRLPAVANISLGAAKHDGFNDAIRGLIAAGVQVAIAAGNSNADACTVSPASTTEAVTVGAAGTEHMNDRQTFSNWGSCLDVFAPGSLIVSASHLDATSSTVKSGTSMAAPHAAGVMALWLHENPALTPAQLQQMIVTNAAQHTVLDAKSANAHMLHSLRGTSVPAAPPSASFSATCSGLSCVFDASASVGSGASIARYDWVFGDSTTASGAVASRAYAAAGSYQVTLRVTDTQGVSSHTVQTVAVSSANQPPTANFAATCQQLACTFTDRSADADGSVVAWSWALGDGTSATARNPSRSFAAPGTYLVRLMVTDNGGATSTVSQSITVSNTPPAADFTYVCSGADCRFTDESLTPSAIRQWSWSFGDGSSSTAQNPSHSYAASGTYVVRLDVTDDFGVKASTTHSVAVVAHGITLRASAYKVKRQHAIDLVWAGATGSQVTIHRNGTPLRTTVNTGAFTDASGTTGRTEYRYRVCEVTGGLCSAEVMVLLR